MEVVYHIAEAPMDIVEGQDRNTSPNRPSSPPQYAADRSGAPSEIEEAFLHEREDRFAVLNRHSEPPETIQ